MNASSGVVCADDYIDEEVAYLLGMLFGRGQLIDDGNVRRLIITLDIRKRKPVMPPGFEVEMDLDLENERALNYARRCVNDLLDANVDVSPIRQGKASLTAVFVKRTIAWRDLELLCSNGRDRASFVLPEFFFDLPSDYHKEFVRGFADIAVTPSFSDYVGKRDDNPVARIAFPVVHDNMRFATQLLELLNVLGVKASLLEGSPRIRGSKKEHRIRMYADHYEKIGFHFEHKQTLLTKLAQYNRKVARKRGRRGKTT